MTDSVSDLLGKADSYIPANNTLILCPQVSSPRNWWDARRWNSFTQTSFLESVNSISKHHTFLPLLLIALIGCYSDTIKQDKAAVLVYLRMRHKDPYKGYILCGIVSHPPR